MIYQIGGGLRWLTAACFVVGMSGLALASMGPVSAVPPLTRYLKVDSLVSGETASSSLPLKVSNWTQGAAVSVAAGPNQIIEMTDSSIIFIDRKSLQQQNDIPLSEWFQTASTTTTTSLKNVYDPQVIYDQYRGRWITTALSGFPSDGYSVLLIAVSVSPDASGFSQWQVSSTDMTLDNGFSPVAPKALPNWCESDRVGIDENNVYVAANEYAVTLTGTIYSISQPYAKVRVFTKNTLYAVPIASPIVAANYNDLTNLGLDSTGVGGLNIQPCHSYGTTTSEYMVASVINANPSGGLGAAVVKGKSAGGNIAPEFKPAPHAGSGAAPSGSGVIQWQVTSSQNNLQVTDKFVPTLAFSDPPVANQADYGSTPAPPRTIPVGDSRLTGAMSQNGQIWTSGTVGALVGNTFVPAVHWMRINISTATALDDHVLHGAPGEAYFLPAIAANSTGATFISFNRSSSSIFPSLMVAAIAPQFGSLPTTTIAAGGNQSWPAARVIFGRYGGISVDPTDGSSVWFGGQVATDVQGGTGSSTEPTFASCDTLVARASLAVSPYSVTYLSQQGLSETWGLAISGGSVAGYGSGPLTGGLLHALRWQGITTTPADLTPGLAAQSQALGIWGPSVGGDAYASGVQFADLWTVQAGGHVTSVNLNPAGFATSTLTGISGGQQVGFGYAPGKDYRALLWSGTARGVVDLTPSTFVRAYALAISGNQQVGAGTKVNGSVHPLIWTGAAQSYIDLLPPSFVGGYALGLSGANQVGFGWDKTTGVQHALLWAGSVASAVDLNPARYGQTVAVALGGGREVGYGSGNDTGGAQHALVWFGSATSFFDLQAVLPSTYVSSTANSVDSAGNIVGTAMDANGNHIAVVWSPQNAG